MGEVIETPKQPFSRKVIETPKEPFSRKAKFFLLCALVFVLLAITLSVVSRTSKTSPSSADAHDPFSAGGITAQPPSPSLSGSPASVPSSNSSDTPSVPLTTPPIKTPTKHPTKKTTEPSTTSPTEPFPDGVTAVTYRPGNLTTLQAGLWLSEGLAARLIATSGEKVGYADGFSESQKAFHGNPDAGETFEDTRGNNPGGWVYVSNSEMPEKGAGGVGAITFDKDGNMLDYKMVLEGTSMNCGGGGTPWNTWVSCEEIEFDGIIYQVDPFGEKQAEVMTLGSDGGRWEAFAYDVRDRNYPRFFATEDHSKGTLRRFTPNDPDWDKPWEMLHGDGDVDFLMIHPTSNSGGTFKWTTDKESAKENARSYYPQTEGVDFYGSQLFFVCKRIYQVFTINLDEGTYTNQTTVNGLFDGKPDQMQRILDDPNDILYFTEEGGVDAGVHARDSIGRFYTILESPVYTDETSGLAFSPDAKHLYIAYQATGKLFDIWRLDGLPFTAKKLDVKHHAMGMGT